MAELPRRDLRDPKALRALAHPVRIKLLEELFLGGPRTATELSERVDESPANCSWHLRQLAAYGFVEEAGGGPGRQRPWRAVLAANSWGDSGEEPELARAGEVAGEVLLEREVELLRAWAASRRQAEPAEWQDAAFVNQSIGWLTLDELREVNGAIRQLFARYLARFADPSTRPAGARPIRFIAWGIPARGYEEDNPNA